MTVVECTTALLACAFVAIGVSAAAAADVSPRPSAGCTVASIQTGRRLERTIDVDGVRRAYILDVPESIRPKTPAPLLFDFHGFGHSAAGVWQVSKFRELAPRERFITVYPDGLPVHLLGRAGLADLYDNEQPRPCVHRAHAGAAGKDVLH